MIWPNILSPRRSARGVCQQLGGDLVRTDTEEDWEELFQTLVTNRIDRCWLRFTDEGHEALWVDRWTGEEKEFRSIPWRLASEPTGDVYENCAGLITEDNERYWAFDIDCSQKIPTVCQDIKELFSLRGLCQYSVIDSLYRLVTDQDNKRTFLGPTGWTIDWDGQNNVWRILNERHPSKCTPDQVGTFLT